MSENMNLKNISFFLSLIFVCLSTLSNAQTPQVPSEIEFADLTIRIHEHARREIQLDVDALHRNKSYFNIKADRINLYLPIVEKELREAGVPLDLKYLVIQESSLIPDAVSTSNAVGFWQFKKGTAEEVFLRVDNVVDERKNIVSSTKGAALYLKKHNAQFDNWMCALVSYQMGLGGAKAYFGTEYNGKRIIVLDRNSHWYFKKFLAHKIAFEGQSALLVSNNRYLDELRVQGPTTLKAIAPRVGVTEAHLKEYNKWTSNGQIPGDKTYTVVYLKEGNIPIQRAVMAKQQPNSPQPSTKAESAKGTSSYPRVTGNQQKATQPNQIKVNNIDGVMAPATTSQESFAATIGVRERKFRKVNDLDKNDRIEAGQYYYTDPKKSKGEVQTHIVQPGETLWAISQMYGIKLSSLKAKNRIRRDRDLKSGMVLNLVDHRSRNEEIRMVPLNSPPRPVQASTPPAEQTPQREVIQTVNQPDPASPQIKSAGNGNGSVAHTVSQGENLFRISQKYGVSVEEIKKWNNLPDNNIRIGQKLTILKP